MAPFAHGSPEYNLTRAQEVAHIGSWHLDITGNTLTCSKEAYRIFGLPIGTLLTYERFVELVHPDDRRSVDDAWRAALAGGRSSLEYRIVVAGEVRWISGIAEIECDEGGTPLRDVGTSQDITQHKVVDDALRTHIQQQGMIVNDYRSWPRARPFILQQTNVTAAVAEPLFCRDRLLGVIVIDDQGSGRQFTEQNRMLLRLFAAQAAVTLENAQLYAQVRQHAEELERKVEERTRELQAANADLEAFSYSVSHDLRSPLISIDGFSTRLLKKYQTVLGAKGQEYLQHVRVAAHHMTERIDALFALARVSHQSIALEPVNLSALARTIAGELCQRSPTVPPR